MLDKEGSGGGKELIFLPYQNAAGDLFRKERDKFEVRTAVDGQRAIQTKSAAEPFLHKEHGIGEERITQRDAQVFFLPTQPVENVLPTFSRRGRISG